jgi:hypothetical protein
MGQASHSDCPGTLVIFPGKPTCSTPVFAGSQAHYSPLGEQINNFL